MILKRYVFLVVITFAGLSCLFSQTIDRPNFALKSHETLGITGIYTVEDNTVIRMSVENRIEDGYFCADRNIYLLLPEGKKIKLERSSGIPSCPDVYRFKNIGERLDFILTFPSIPAGTGWVDIVEECNDNCFWFYGVTLDNELNRRLDEAFMKAADATPSEKIEFFKDILDDIDSQDLGVEGLLYFNIIIAASEDTDSKSAMTWYRRFTASGAPRRDHFIRLLNEQGIEY